MVYPKSNEQKRNHFTNYPNMKKTILSVSFKTLGQAVNASVLIGAITFIAGEQQRRASQVYQAWQVITVANGQSGSGGRIQALEFLNSQPRRIPWFWLHWERENLSGLEAPKAHLMPYRTDSNKKGIQLQEAFLVGANLQEARLIDANLQGATLIGANLQGAFLSSANLQGAFLYSANLQRASLSSANLQGASLNSANLQGASLSGANLQGALLTKANLQRATLIGANLQEAGLYETNLQEARLDKANLQEARLDKANLQEASLTRANLQGALLASANLQGAKYTDKNTSQKTCEDLDFIYKDYPCPTIFPPNFDPKTKGMILLK